MWQCSPMFPIGRHVELSNEEMAYILAAIQLQSGQVVTTEEDRRKLKLIAEKIKRGKLICSNGHSTIRKGEGGLAHGQNGSESQDLGA